MNNSTFKDNIRFNCCSVCVIHAGCLPVQPVRRVPRLTAAKWRPAASKRWSARTRGWQRWTANLPKYMPQLPKKRSTSIRRFSRQSSAAGSRGATTAGRALTGANVSRTIIALRITELQAKYRLVPATGPVTYACDGDPKNEVVVTFFKTDPPTLIAERGDQVSLMYLQPAASGARYQGPQRIFLGTPG